MRGPSDQNATADAGEPAAVSRQSMRAFMAALGDTSDLRPVAQPVSPDFEIAVIGDKPAAGVLQPGDVILTLDGKSITKPNEVSDGMRAVRPGARVSIVFLRGGSRHTVSIRSVSEQGHAVIGVYVAAPLHFPIEVNIDTSNIGGPSAGLAMTLSILDELTPGNLTGGKLVAVTGEIAPDGSVLEVGGVAQKAVAARHRGAQLFIVPIAEVADARKRAGSMPVVGVRSLDDALKALRAAGGDPLPALKGARTAA